MNQPPAVTVTLMAEENSNCVDDRSADWAGNWGMLAALWGIPAAAMLAASFAEPTLRAVIWTGILIWMGVACLLNARRCDRTHCRFTGPFFMVMAALVVAYAAGVLPLGPYGWVVLGVATAIGNTLIWWGSERILGAYGRPR